MSKDLEQRVDRLEKFAGSTGANIHEFDSPEQAAAYEAQLAADAEAEAKLHEVAATPAAETAAAEADIDLATVAGTGAEGKVTKTDVEKAKGA